MKHLIVTVLSLALVFLSLVGCGGQKAPTSADWNGTWSWHRDGATQAGISFDLAGAGPTPFKVPYRAFDDSAELDLVHMGSIEGNTLMLADEDNASAVRLIVTFEPRKSGREDDILVFTKTRAGDIATWPGSLPERFELSRNTATRDKVQAGIKAAQNYGQETAQGTASEQTVNAPGMDFAGEFKTGVFVSVKGNLAYFLKKDGKLMRVVVGGGAVTSGSEIGQWKEIVRDAASGDRMLEVKRVDEASGDTVEELWDMLDGASFATPSGEMYKRSFDPEA